MRFLRLLAKTLLRCVLIAVLLYLSVGMLLSMVAMGMPQSMARQATWVPVTVGFLGGLVLFVAGCRFFVLYVFGHELTHWLAAKLFGRRTGRFRVGKSGGSVAVERPNVWIVLAPYFVPVYTVIWVGLYGITCFFWRAPSPFVVQAFYGGVGVTYAFHIVLTVHSLSREQTDLRAYGRPLSMSLIFFCNILIVFVTVTIAGRQVGEGVRRFCDQLALQWQWVLWCGGCVRALLRQALQAGSG